MLPTFQTARLTIRPLTLTDAENLFEIYRDDRAMQFMPTPPHTEIEQTRDLVARQLSFPEACHWVICQQNEAKAIGHIDFLGQVRIPGMGYILHPDYWGQGIVVEASRPVIDYGFKQLGYDRLELWIDETNHTSLRVAQKLGFKFKGRFPLKFQHETHPHFKTVWGICAEEWLTDHAPAPSITPHFFGVEAVLEVHDIEATTAYYRDKLGFVIDFLYGNPAVHAGVSRGEWTRQMADLQFSKIPLEQAIQPTAYFRIMVDSQIDALYEDYQSKGVKILAEPADKPWGFREFTIQDLNGYRLVFATYL